MIRKLTKRQLHELTAAEAPGMSSGDRDEMAIPSYTHSNPLIRWLMWERYERIAAMAGFRSDQRVFEFGCGMGVFLPELTQRCGEVFATDLYPTYARALCQKLGLDVRFVERLDDLPEQGLDRIVAADVLEHIDHLEPYLSMFLRKLKPDGHLIVSGPTENAAYRFGRQLAGFFGKGDYHVTNIDKLIDAISSGGFRLTSRSHLPFTLPPHLFKICVFTPNAN